MSYISNIWLYPLQDWWRTVNEMSNFLHTGEIGNFDFSPCAENLLTFMLTEKPLRMSYSYCHVLRSCAGEWANASKIYHAAVGRLVHGPRKIFNSETAADGCVYICEQTSICASSVEL